MNHFDITQWTDFARGVTPDADRAAMQAHVTSGCVRCRETLNLVMRVFRSARVDDIHEPPDHVVRCAKAIGALLTPQPSRLSRLIGQLVYDSLGELAPAGLRSEDRVSRHGLYEAGDFYVDVRLEQEKGSRVATLVGQLTNRRDPDNSMAEAPVLLMARKDIIAHAVYNRFGEFQMDYAPAPDLHLRVALTPPSKRLDLSLKQLVAEMPNSSDRGKPLSAKQGRNQAASKLK
jgi:hypothetical protein